MDPATVLPWIIGGTLALGAITIMGWVYTTKLRIQNGYPLDGAWGKPVKPTRDPQAMQRVQLLTQENAQLRAELDAVKDRLGNVERIVTDSGYQLTREFAKIEDGEGQLQ